MHGATVSPARSVLREVPAQPSLYKREELTRAVWVLVLGVGLVVRQANMWARLVAGPCAMSEGIKGTVQLDKYLWAGPRRQEQVPRTFAWMRRRSGTTGGPVRLR